MRDKTRDKIMAAPEKTERRESRKTEGKPARASSKEGEGTKAEAPGFCRKGGSRLKPEEKKRGIREKSAGVSKAGENRFQRKIEEQYSCTKYCRCCPFPGLKCVESGRPVH